MFSTYDTTQKTRQGAQFASQGKRHGSTLGLNTGTSGSFFNKVGIRNNRNLRESSDHLAGKYLDTQSARKASANRSSGFYPQPLSANKLHQSSGSINRAHALLKDNQPSSSRFAGNPLTTTSKGKESSG